MLGREKVSEDGWYEADALKMVKGMLITWKLRELREISRQIENNSLWIGDGQEGYKKRFVKMHGC